MRDIEFRGKCEENSKWYFGDLVTNRGGTPTHIRQDATPTPIIPETVGQYTGLKDKNGKKIYEGDILRYFGDIGVVGFEESRARFTCQFDNYKKTYEFYFGRQEEIEVIGNINDNSELLEANNG